MRRWLLFGMCLSLLACRPGPPRSIGLRSLGCFPPMLRDSIAAAIAQCYGLDVVALPDGFLPAAGFNNDKGPRYSADSVLKVLDAGRPAEVDCCIGFTMADIFSTRKTGEKMSLQQRVRNSNWGIFGLGEQGGRSCVVSIARLRVGEAALLRDRAVKVSLHEVGHVMGLPHCPDPGCVMTDAAGKLSTVDRAGRRLCAGCRAKLGLP